MVAAIEQPAAPKFCFVITENADSLLCIHEEYLVYLNAKSCPDFASILNRVMSAKSLTSAELAAAQRIMLKNILSITHNPLENTLHLRLRPDSSRTKFIVLGIENGGFVQELAEICGMNGPTRRRTSLAEFSTSQKSILAVILATLAGMLIWMLSGWDDEAASTPGAGKAGFLKKVVALLLGLLRVMGNVAIVICSGLLVGILAYWLWHYAKHPELTCYSRSSRQGSSGNK